MEEHPPNVGGGECGRALARPREDADHALEKDMKKIIRIQFLILFFLLISALGCAPAMDCSNLQANEACTRVLFIGNSYTYVNDLPTTFANLARAGGHKTEVGMSAQGGWMLADHVKSPDTLAKIDSEKWNFVVLQEQSEVPSI